MIFVTVGTHEQPFNRLIQKVDELKRDGIIKDAVWKNKMHIDSQAGYWKVISLIRTLLIVTIGWIFDCTYTAGAAGKLFIHLFEFGKTDLSVISLTTTDIAVLFVGCFVLLLVDVLHEKNLEVRQIIGTKNYWVQVVFWTIVVQMIACFGRVASAGGFMYAPCILYDLDGYYTGLRMLLGHMIETGLSSEERQEGIYFAKDLAEIKAILSR